MHARNKKSRIQNARHFSEAFTASSSSAAAATLLRSGGVWIADFGPQGFVDSQTDGWQNIADAKCGSNIVQA